jgi:hypothetical protein
MMSLEAIKQVSREAAEKAALDNLEPYIVWNEDLDYMPPFPFPFLGDYDPPGWTKVNEFFVDSSGFGTPGEPALTSEQFKQKIVIGHGYAVTEVGQFQAYVGEFVKS